MQIGMRNLRHTAATLLVLALSGAAACAGEPPRRPNLMHPVHERRAVEIIARVFSDAGLDPEQNRNSTYNGKPLRLDVAAAGRKFGICYRTRQDQEDLGDVLPKHDSDSDALVIVAGSDGNRILLLYERDYLTDDLEGEAHSATTIAAEKKIERDARDLIVKAEHEKWP
jgi:hypothetical protein